MTKKMIKHLDDIEYAVAVIPTHKATLLHPATLKPFTIYTFVKKGIDKKNCRIVYINELQRWMDVRLFEETEIGLN